MGCTRRQSSVCIESHHGYPRRLQSIMFIYPLSHCDTCHAVSDSCHLCTHDGATRTRLPSCLMQIRNGHRQTRSLSSDSGQHWCRITVPKRWETYRVSLWLWKLVDGLQSSFRWGPGNPVTLVSCWHGSDSVGRPQCPVFEWRRPRRNSEGLQSPSSNIYICTCCMRG